MASEDEQNLVDSDEEVENPNEFIPIDDHLAGDDDGAPEWLVKVPILPCWDETDGRQKKANNFNSSFFCLLSFIQLTCTKPNNINILHL
jgi:hypothetical protein